MKHHDKAGTVNVDLELSAANPDEFDALLVPGGALNADALRVVPKAQEFARKMDREGKPLAVICLLGRPFYGAASMRVTMNLLSVTISDRHHFTLELISWRSPRSAW
jgi:enhancing lycopene biosynthesis protein 2